MNDAKTTIRRNDQPNAEELFPAVNDNLVMNHTFIEAVRSGDSSKILCDFEDGARTFAVTLACQRSAEERQPITIATFVQQ